MRPVHAIRPVHALRAVRRGLLAATLALVALPAGALEGTPAGGLDPRAAEQQVQRQQSQPMNNAPVWSEVRSGQPQSTAVQGRETGVLIQAGGERWRNIRNGIIAPWGAALLLAGALAVLAVFLWKGPVRIAGPLSGRMILRFRYSQRFIHWSVATLFVLLGLSGLNLAFGRYILRPLIGATLFGWLGELSKLVHNLAGPLFAVFVVLGAVAFMRDCLPRAYDVRWLLTGGGAIGGRDVPAGKFNAGQKVWFWGGLLFFGLIMSVSGFVLDFPNMDQTRATMQLCQLLHSAAAVVFIALSFFHIYLGTVGQEGAFDAMRTGWVDETWARQHHELWYNDVMSGKEPQAEGEPRAAPPGLANP